MQLLRVCVCVSMRVHACARHQWQHLRLSVWLSSVETEAHQAVLTCNSDELCKSSMKLNLRLGPQHNTHTRAYTHTLPSDGCLDNTWPCVCVCMCAHWYFKPDTFIKWLCSMCQCVYMVRCIVAMIHVCFNCVTCGPIVDSWFSSMTSWILHRYDFACIDCVCVSVCVVAYLLLPYFCTL